jgi:type II secretory pathway pseudopilin PulG
LSAWSRLLRPRDGFTLVETMLALSILVLVVVTAVGAMLVGQRNAQKVAAMEETTQQLRLAIRQMTTDMTYARWDSTSPPAGTAYAQIYQPYTVLGSGDGEWPGDLDPSPEFQLTYAISADGSLIREIFEPNFAQTYTRQVLVAGLRSDSALSVDASSQTVQVRLRKTMPGGTKVAEVSSTFFLR